MILREFRASILLFLTTSLSFLGACSRVPEHADLNAVRNVLDAQVQAWNEGSIERYMTGYWRSDSTTFVSGGSIRRGYDSLLVRYRQSYPDRSAMGFLTFEELELRELAATTVVASGIWRLKREKDEPWGRFTLIVEEKPEGWRVVYDHTSSSH